MRYLHDTEFLNLYDNKQKVSEETLLLFAAAGSIIHEGEPRRWSQTIISITKIGERYFKFTWEGGLTELQSDSCYDQPVEVFKVKRDEIIPAYVAHIVDWVEVNSSTKK